MKLSLILCSRNDNYQGNSRWRLETALNYLGARVHERGRAPDVEVIVADWGSEVPLAGAVRLTREAAQIVSFLWVPPDLARAQQGDSPFPEVLALNAAARRAAGDFIGRIDQDTLVGGRFLDCFFRSIGEGRVSGLPGVRPETALFFANRRGIPYRFVEQQPSVEQIERFLERFGAGLKVWCANGATGHVFWTSYVGIWLAHRDRWCEAGGYDERFIYYNWMETDMIWRLKQRYEVVDLGRLTGQDFYHLDHDHPRRLASAGRPHGRNNPNVDLQSPPAMMRPNGPGWGLKDAALILAPGVPGGSLTSNVRSLRELVTAWRLADARDWLAIAVDRRLRASARFHPRKVIAEVLSRMGLLGTARRTSLRWRLFSDPDLRRRYREDTERFVRFTREDAGGVRLVPSAPSNGVALMVSSRCPSVEGDLAIIKALQVSGFTPVVLLEDERRGLRPFYEMAGVRDVRSWSEFTTSRNFGREARAAIARCGSLDALLTLTADGARVGMTTVCTAMRRLRVGMLDWQDAAVRRRLADGLAASMSAAVEARTILAALHPTVVLTPPEYTPHTELFDACLAQGITPISHDQSHRRDAVVFKRYSSANHEDHLTTLSAASWRVARGMHWTNARRQQLDEEIDGCYRSGDWYRAAWTPGAPEEGAAVKRMLGLDADRPTAVIFPHMLWDAPVMWGRPLFRTYQDWLLDTLDAAAANTRVNWVVKIHPAHIWKQGSEGYTSASAEEQVIRRRFGSVPPHVTLLMPDTPISTMALLRAADVCLTVRGTVGIEAARLGVPVVTAGPARYSGLGFTVDSSSRDEYLGRVAAIERTPRLSDAGRELAERFAYAVLLLRPLRFRSVRWDNHRFDMTASDTFRPGCVTVRSEDGWRRSPDIRALSEWFAGRDEDFLNPL